MDWYPWYFTIYEQDTMHLNPYQDGCYRRLLDHYMRTRSPLPDNDAALARIIGDSLENWRENASRIVRAFFTHTDGMLLHRFCDKILEEQDELSKSRSKSAKIAAEKRWKNKNKETNENKDIDAAPMRHACDSYAAPMRENATGQDITLQEEKEDTNVSSKKAVQKKKGTRLPPDWELQQEMGEWAEAQGMKPSDIEREAAIFKNYWTAKTEKATKLDWDATWKNWIYRKLSGEK